MKHSCLAILLINFLVYSCQIDNAVAIDRQLVVQRNNVVLEEVDTLGSLTVGNGSFAYTADISGLQSFHEHYENGISLGTQSEWGWHSTPNTKGYAYEEVLETYPSCNDHLIPIAIQHKEGRKKDATNYLRNNPHRLHLGIIGLKFYDNQGNVLPIDSLKSPKQELDLWEGSIKSTYEVEGHEVEVILYGHQEEDAIGFKINSTLLDQGKLTIKINFPYGKECHVCPGYDWGSTDKHESNLHSVDGAGFSISRTLDTAQYFVSGSWEGNARIEEKSKHHFEIIPGENQQNFQCVIRFNPKSNNKPLPKFDEVQESSMKGWKHYWENGGIMDFSECTDSRAPELERRIVLSQYLMKVNCSGNYPPQETGLTMNSWYGKFHLEMHWWHGVHFPLWGRPELLEKSLPWYDQIMEEARAIATRQHFDGVRWPKMTSREGISSPSSVGEFLIWQQPHPIYFAELIYRNNPSEMVLNRYKDIVFETAAFMASFAQWNESEKLYHLCAPIIPAQEIFHASETNDPIFEMVYWDFALRKAILWKERLGEEVPKLWEDVVENLAPLPKHEGLYLPCAGAYEAYSNLENRRDHPIVTGVYGMLPLSEKVDTSIMAATFEEVMNNWQWKTTWGWDYPMLAMAAARLNKPEQAIEALFLGQNKNTYLINGHNYQDERLRLYLPGNGGLLIAIAMMAAGWENGPKNKNPGFPKDGSWDVKWEGLKPML